MQGQLAAVPSIKHRRRLPPAHLLPRAGKPAGPKRRFQEGSVDEVCLLAPELGPLEAVMVAPEGGSWVLDECDVWSSRTNHLDR